MGLPPSDRDFAVLAPSYEAMRNYLLEQGATFYQERPQFVSIKAKLFPFGAVDFTLARKESFYTDGRHPDSVTPAQTIEEDLRRRDFTMNAMAREAGDILIIDPFDGQGAITNKVIQTVGCSFERFQEDRLRIFRALRFACSLNFEMSYNVESGIRYFGDEDFESVSPERVQVELSKMFRANTTKAITLLSNFPHLLSVMNKKNVWLKATLEQK
jgi:tRNA nucleotidyltransferase/poly(A) polymerase